VLLGGDHKKVAAWRQEMRETTTRERRPDLWDRYLANRQPKGVPSPTKTKD
jgi:tRNA (guanine37-N1)-methyltransferase